MSTATLPDSTLVTCSARTVAPPSSAPPTFVQFTKCVPPRGMAALAIESAFQIRLHPAGQMSSRHVPGRGGGRTRGKVAGKRNAPVNHVHSWRLGDSAVACPAGRPSAPARMRGRNVRLQTRACRSGVAGRFRGRRGSGGGGERAMAKRKMTPRLPRSAHHIGHRICRPVRCARAPAEPDSCGRKTIHVRWPNLTDSVTDKWTAVQSEGGGLTSHVGAAACCRLPFPKISKAREAR
jgi:hypothetical protein